MCTNFGYLDTHLFEKFCSLNNFFKRLSFIRRINDNMVWTHIFVYQKIVFAAVIRLHLLNNKIFPTQIFTQPSFKRIKIIYFFSLTHFSIRVYFGLFIFYRHNCLSLRALLQTLGRWSGRNLFIGYYSFAGLSLNILLFLLQICLTVFFAPNCKTNTLNFCLWVNFIETYSIFVWITRTFYAFRSLCMVPFVWCVCFVFNVIIANFSLRHFLLSEICTHWL